MSHLELLQEMWRRGQCPILNGVTFDTGEVDLVMLRFVRAPLLRVQAQPAIRTSLLELAQSQEISWTHIDTLCEVALPSAGLVVRSGDGGFGGDGFVAVSRAHDNHLHRLMFFEDSNPFVRVVVEGGLVRAVSNDGLTWTLDLGTLEVLNVG